MAIATSCGVLSAPNAARMRVIVIAPQESLRPRLLEIASSFSPLATRRNISTPRFGSFGSKRSPQPSTLDVTIRGGGTAEHGVDVSGGTKSLGSAAGAA